MNIEARIAAALASPKTHRVVTTMADGKTRIQETRSFGSAELHAEGERRKIGRDLLGRDENLMLVPVRVVSVVVEEIAK